MPASPLIPLPLISPGLNGLNTAYSAFTGLGPEWCAQAQNCYFDTAGRLAARQGWVQVNPAAITAAPTIVQIFEYVTGTGNATLISVGSNSNIYAGGNSPSNVTGTLLPTGPNWQFVNFNNKVIGAQSGNTLIEYTGSGTFANVVASSGSVPNGNCICAAFGRLWALGSDGNTIFYSGLLDETNWGNPGSGSINMAAIWTHGQDQVVGIYAMGANLVVYGQHHIVLFADGTGSTIGLDPNQMYVVDTVEGTGLVARDLVQSIGTGDQLYVSPTGLQSLVRVVANQNNPIMPLDRHCWDYIDSFLSGENLAQVRSVYSPNDKFFLLYLPKSGRVFCYDVRKTIQGSPLVPDGSFRITEWVYAAQCGVCSINLGVYQGFQGGFIGQYQGYTDNTATYPYLYESPFIADVPQEDGGQLENRLKIPKRLGSIIYTQAANNLVYSWGFDFQPFAFTSTQAVPGAKIPEYSTAEYGTNGVYDLLDPTAIAGTNYSEYGGTLILRTVSMPMAGTGRWLQLAVSATINGSNLAIQELDIYLKTGVMR